jgi:putative ABC transport system permease protein
MNALAFAWRSLVRQPARATLGVAGVAAVGALLFDMLLLSEGLVVSMRDLLDRTGFDIRVTATGDFPGLGPRLDGASGIVENIAALPSVRSAIAVRLAEGRIERAGEPGAATSFQGVAGGPARPWTVVRGRDVEAPSEVVVNDRVAETFGAAPGSTLVVRASCQREQESLPAVTLRVAGVAEFPFEPPGDRTIAGTLQTLDAACGGNSGDQADLILVMSNENTDGAAAAIQARRPDLRALTNEEMIGRFQQGGFTYFRQISAVLTAVTVTFALLLITVLLTVSVNQRLGEIAALRALGFSQRRIAADVLSESSLIVGAGGLLSLPLGALLAVWLDRILKGIPGLPAQVHFFVFETEALAVHLVLLVITALVAALYPVSIVVRLPIAATLRNEVIS